MLTQGKRMKLSVGKEVTSTLLLTAVLAVSFCSISMSAYSSKTVVAVYGSTPNIDGTIEDGEWDDASTVIISVTDGANCTIYAKQDAANLYVGFNITDSTHNTSDSCAIVFDVNHDGSTSLQTDDIWLAVSRIGTKGEFNVTAGGWFPTIVSGWTAKTSSTSDVWQLEYNITYSKLDITAGTNKTLGIMFLIVNKDVEMGWYIWPSTASISKPSTWGSMTPNGYNWVPEFSTWASILVTFIILTVAIALCKRRLLKTSLHSN